MRSASELAFFDFSSATSSNPLAAESLGISPGISFMKAILNSSGSRLAFYPTLASGAWRAFGRASLVVLCGLLSACGSTPTPGQGGAGVAASGGAPSYAIDVAPILKQNCTSCHGGLVANKGLRLSSLSKIYKGGESGPAVVPGAPRSSPLYTALLYPVSDVRHMPPAATNPQLTAAQKQTISRWIAAGAQ